LLASLVCTDERRHVCANARHQWRITIGLVMILLYRDPATLEWGFITATSSGDGYTYEHQAEAVADRHLAEMRTA
jgi:hypothetical protein